jgi:FkbM family methyltransferase
MAQNPRRTLFSRREIMCMGLPLALVGAFRLNSDALVKYPAGVYALSLVGRTGVCSRAQAVDGYRLAHAQNAASDALVRRSQILSEDRGLVQYKTPHGIFWAPKGTNVFWVLAEQERKVYGEGKFRVRPGDIVLDCGANVGAFTREALDAGAKLVVAIEPSPLNVESLRRTFAADIEAGRVIVYPKGVWNTDSELPMYLYENSALDSIVMSERREDSSGPKRLVKVPLTTIDKMAAELKLDRVDFIKMDVEGCERQAIDGAAGTIARFKPRMSIAAENLDDDQYVIPQRVRAANRQYQYTCSSCTPVSIYEIRPEVLFFY